MSLKFPRRCSWSVGTTKDKGGLVKWRGNTYSIQKSRKKWHMLENRCPHRGVQLDKLKCPYHGWEFNKDGYLIKVPSTHNLPRGCNLSTIDLIEAHDLLWIFDDNDVMEIPLELSNPKWNTLTGSKVVEGNWLRWVENLVDIAHINHVHDFGDENDGLVSNYNIEELVCTANVRPKAVNIFTQHLQVPECPIRMQFIPPSSAMVTIQLKGSEFITFTTVTPIDTTTSRLTWIFGYSNIPKNILLDALLYKEMEETIAEDENIIKGIPMNASSNVNVQSDMFQIKCVKIIDELYYSNGWRSLG